MPDIDEAWYEFDVPTSAIPTGMAAIYLPRVYLNANVYLNRKLIGSGGSMLPPIAKNAHRPLYFTIPRDTWQAENNKIQIQHKSYPGTGYIQAIMLGGVEEISPLFQHRYWLQQTLPKALFVLEVLAALLVFKIWLARPSQQSYLWFGLSMSMLSLVTLNHFLVTPVIGHKAWATINNTAIDWWLIFLNLFVFSQLSELEYPVTFKKSLLSKLHLNQQRSLRLSLLYALSVLGYYTLLPLSALPGTLLFHSASFLILLLTCFYLLWLKTRWHMPVTPYLLLYTSLVFIGVNDLTLQLGWRNDGQFILYLAAPVSCLLIVGYIVNEFIGAMRQNEQHTLQLQETVSRVKSELRSQYQVLQKISNEKAKMAEREHIYRDLHDDVGAKLLSLYYRAKDSESGSLAQSALQDLRDIVSRSSNNGETLGDAIHQWHNESIERAREHQINMHWHYDSIKTAARLDEIQYMHLTRMLREAISNALHHSTALSEVSVTIFERQKQIVFQVKNNGASIPVNQWQHGRGLHNIFIRARELNGEAAINQTGINEVCIEWGLPAAML